MEPGTRGTRIAHVVRIVRKYRLDGLRCLESSLPIGTFYYILFLAQWAERMMLLSGQRPFCTKGHSEKPGREKDSGEMKRLDTP